MSDIDPLMARLDAIDAKLDYVVARQRYVEEFVRDMTPVAREGIVVAAAQLADWEERGWFALASELFVLLERLADAYGPDDVHELADNVVQLVDTVRNVAQPDVLELANDATDVIHHADEVEPVGPMGMAMATRDPDVQHGLAIALEVLRQLGRARGGPSVAVREGKPSAAPRRATKGSTPAAPKAAKAAPATGPVQWEGRAFTPEGFLIDPSTWDDDLATKMAAGLGITLTDEHWTVLRWAREDCLASGASPNVRRIATGSGVGTKRLYELFPRTPGKSVAMVAGIGKPVGCV